MESGVYPVQSGFKYVLKQKYFVRLWGAQISGQLADKFFMFSLIILAYYLSKASLDVAILLLAYNLPSIILSPIAGVYVDRHGKKGVMVWTTFARAAILALVPYTGYILPEVSPILKLFIITLAYACFGQFFAPAESAAIPTMLPSSAFMTANSMVVMTMFVTLVLGGVLAPIATTVNIYLPYYIGTALFLCAGLLLVLTRIPRATLLQSSITGSWWSRFAKELGESFTYISKSTPLMFAFTQLSTAVLVILMVFTLAPAYMHTVLSIAATRSYVVLVPATLGALLSAFLLGQFFRHHERGLMLVYTLMASGVTIAALGGVPLALRHITFLSREAAPVAAFFSFLVGMEFGALIVPAITILMERTRDKIRGRIFGVIMMVINGAAAIPIMFAGWMADVVGVANVMAALGLLLFALSLIFLIGRKIGKFQLIEYVEHFIEYPDELQDDL
jgi:MFS family permease